MLDDDSDGTPMHKKRSRLTLAVLGVVAALWVPFVVSTNAYAAPDDVTWAVTPATPDGADTRGFIQQELDPGASREDHLAVRNLSRTEITFRLHAADGYYTDRGRFNMLPSDQESVDAGRWISLPETVTVEPNATVVVPFTTTVPADAIPGDHAAGIAASVTSTGTDANGSTVGVESRVGFRVLTRVAGEIVPAFTVDGIDSAYDMSWNPFQPGAVTTTFTVHNTGNASLAVAGVVGFGGAQTNVPGDDTQRQELLPGESRTLTATIPGVWPTFYVPGEVALAPTASDLSGAAVTVAASSTAASLWAVPVPQLLVLLGVALLLLALLWRRRRFAAALDRARSEGRASALQPDAPTQTSPSEPADPPARRSRRLPVSSPAMEHQ